eukprot:gnl/MRDRNA2_/MRDRNA2_57007_c0_seq2.p1 gnl/MRDRNA2_/MRDRNA2_57007_c0~~gnl/MRDRNA2_/MRDRNA2_57007_c0_seq2.p1  ORF type:complete len:258 (+),score=64.64 gnl/MRDRNA2_/MRDRNA2_57007_c0_seq2:906-1679(+)
MHMIKILKLLDPHLQLCGKGGRKMQMSDAADELDVEAFMQLTDAFIVSVLMGRHVPQAALHTCEEYERVFCKRELMRLVGDWDLPREISRSFDVDEIADGVTETYYAASEKAIPGNSLHPLAKEALRVTVVDLHHGMKTNDPLKRVLFHSTKGPQMDFFGQEDIKPMRRKIFVFLHDDPPGEGEQQILKLRRLSWAFEQWAEHQEKIEVRRQSFANTPNKKDRKGDGQEDKDEEQVQPKRALKINYSVAPFDPPSFS